MTWSRTMAKAKAKSPFRGRWQGRGWAVLKGDEIHGMIFFHQSDESGFVAKKSKRKAAH